MIDRLAVVLAIASASTGTTVAAEPPDALGLLVAARQEAPATESAVPAEDAPAPDSTEEGDGLMFKRVERGTYVSGGYLHEFGSDFSEDEGTPIGH